MAMLKLQLFCTQKLYFIKNLLKFCHLEPSQWGQIILWNSTQPFKVSLYFWVRSKKKRAYFKALSEPFLTLNVPPSCLPGQVAAGAAWREWVQQWRLRRREIRGAAGSRWAACRSWCFAWVASAWVRGAAPIAWQTRRTWAECPRMVRAVPVPVQGCVRHGQGSTRDRSSSQLEGNKNYLVFNSSFPFQTNFRIHDFLHNSRLLL